MTELLRSPLYYVLLLPLAAVLGCGEAQPQSPSESSTPPAQTQSNFDANTAGTITGQVTWTGSPLAVPPFEIRAFIPTGKPGQPRLIRENPNAPHIDPTTHGIAGAIIFLRSVPPEKARPWNHAPVRIEQRDRRLHIIQGNTDANIGFVRRGDDVEMVSRDDCFHSLHADGSAFFTLTFPDRDQPRKRRLTSRGIVELSSATGYYWMRAYLFVDDHPYYTRTDAQGRFQLDRVPPGRYEVVCWHPSWIEQRHNRDPETSLVTRIFFHPAEERTRSVELAPHGTATAEFTLSISDFAR